MIWPIANRPLTGGAKQQADFHRMSEPIDGAGDRAKKPHDGSTTRYRAYLAEWLSP